MIKQPLEALYFHDFSNSYIPNILHEIYYEKIYLPYLVGKKDMIICDWGANIGVTSYYFKDFAKQVYSVEPSAQHLECLNAMIKQNNVKNIKVCPYAISNINGKTKFFHNPNSTMFSLKDTVNNKDDFEEVETVTPDEFMKREGIEHIDLLKFDLEGFESEVMASEGFKSIVPKIDTIIFEYHQWTVASKDMIANTLRDLGYNVKWLNGTEATIGVATR